jgi:hypothetical protein
MAQPPTETTGFPDAFSVGSNSDGDVGSNQNGHNMDSLIDDEDEEETSATSGGAMMHFDPVHGIQEPNPHDILCGRGRSTSDHPANVRFRQLINQNKDSYQKAKRRDEKTKITCELVDRLRRDGR